MITLIILGIAAGIAGIIYTCAHSCRKLSCCLGQIELKQMHTHST